MCVIVTLITLATVTSHHLYTNHYGQEVTVMFCTGKPTEVTWLECHHPDGSACLVHYLKSEQLRQSCCTIIHPHVLCSAFKTE